MLSGWWGPRARAREDGATAVEYALILTGIAAAALFVLILLLIVRWVVAP